MVNIIRQYYDQIVRKLLFRIRGTFTRNRVDIGVGREGEFISQGGRDALERPECY